MFHLISLAKKSLSSFVKNSKNYYYQKNYYIFKLPIKNLNIRFSPSKEAIKDEFSHMPALKSDSVFLRFKLIFI